MKLVLKVEVEHPSVGVNLLLLALPQALASVRAATAAGVAETGPLGMTVQASGTEALLRVGFVITFEETSGERRLPDAEPV